MAGRFAEANPRVCNCLTPERVLRNPREHETVPGGRFVICAGRMRRER